MKDLKTYLSERKTSVLSFLTSGGRIFIKRFVILLLYSQLDYWSEHETQVKIPFSDPTLGTSFVLFLCKSLRCVSLYSDVGLKRGAIDVGDVKSICQNNKCIENLWDYTSLHRE